MTTERELREQEQKDVDDFLEQEYRVRSVKESLITIGICVAVVLIAYFVLG